jgi:curved DNA-binding protein CbpA
MLKHLFLIRKPAQTLHHFPRLSFGDYYNPQNEDPFDVLEVPKTASFDQIKAAYFKLAQEYHPDSNKERDTTKQFQRISIAYQKIKDMKKEGYRFAEDKSSSSSSKPKDDDFYSPAGGSYRGKNEQKRDQSWKYKGEAMDKTAGMTPEERIYFKIFGKTFREDPSFFYKPENASKRSVFEREMDHLKAAEREAERRARETEKFYEYEEQKEARAKRERERQGFKATSPHPEPEIKLSVGAIAAVLSVVVGGGLFLWSKTVIVSFLS